MYSVVEELVYDFCKRNKFMVMHPSDSILKYPKHTIHSLVKKLQEKLFQESPTQVVRNSAFFMNHFYTEKNTFGNLIDHYAKLLILESVAKGYDLMYINSYAEYKKAVKNYKEEI